MYCSKDRLLGAGRNAPSLETLSGSVHYGSTNNQSHGRSSAWRFWFDNDESVVSRLQKAREKKSDAKTWAATAANYCISTVLFALTVLLTTVLPLAEAVVGGISVGQCPREPMIPVNLIVGGILGALSSSLNIAVRWHNLQADVSDPDFTSRKYLVVRVLTAIFNVGVLIVFIVGCVYVYRSLWPSEDPTSSSYCSPGAFYFAFWLHNSVFLFLLLLTCVALIGTVVNAFFC
ncbi:transmembrane protein 272-like isoform X2 [Ornithodoros turicata]|uniref:transmembrane protein 272-like isoform X2 n=1 Tax=Ornithodoros turicata TaxID=34597 RepID=UPI003138C0CE